MSRATTAARRAHQHRAYGSGPHPIGLGVFAHGAPGGWRARWRSSTSHRSARFSGGMGLRRRPDPPRRQQALTIGVTPAPGWRTMVRSALATPCRPGARVPCRGQVPPGGAAPRRAALGPAVRQRQRRVGPVPRTGPLDQCGRRSRGKGCAAQRAVGSRYHTQPGLGCHSHGSRPWFLHSRVNRSVMDRDSNGVQSCWSVLRKIFGKPSERPSENLRHPWVGAAPVACRPPTASPAERSGRTAPACAAVAQRPLPTQRCHRKGGGRPHCAQILERAPGWPATPARARWSARWDATTRHASWNMPSSASCCGGSGAALAAFTACCGRMVRHVTRDSPTPRSHVWHTRPLFAIL